MNRSFVLTLVVSVRSCVRSIGVEIEVEKEGRKGNEKAACVKGEPGIYLKSRRKGAWWFMRIMFGHHSDGKVLCHQIHVLRTAWANLGLYIMKF